MTLRDYLDGEFTGIPAEGDRGIESDWLYLCELHVRGSKIQVVDASFVPDPIQGWMVAVSPGLYHIEVKAMAFGRDVRVSRLRVVLNGVGPSVGAVLGETGTDTGNIGVCDHEGFARAWGDDSDGSWDVISPAIEDADTYGIAVLDETVGAIMPFVCSGFGDGIFPVYELVAEGSRAGFEVVFIQPDEPYPFSIGPGVAPGNTRFT